MRRILLWAVLCCAAVAARAESGYDAWLRYERLPDSALARYRQAVPAVVYVDGTGELLSSARDELIRGVQGMIGHTLRVHTGGLPSEGAIVIATGAQLPGDGYSLKTVTGPRRILITGANDRGALYGVFALLRKIALLQPIDNLDETSNPYAPVRWINQWDNLDGTIERGYGGRSIFWDNGHVRSDLTRVSDYGRLLASLGVNACSINNVNANPQVITPEYLPEVARIATAFRPWGVRIALSIDFGSPRTVGGLDTFDPLDPSVIAWWKSTVDAIYGKVPDLAGIVIKADSEGRVGPSAYGRTHADAANVVARALKPHGGLLFYRGFVYDHHMDWRNLKNDRARAAYDNFKDLDGKFDDNVVIQIKHGPIDFQVREPASPLFGALERTNQAVELQVTQEYFGQARHMVFLAPMWKETLDFDMHARPGEPTPVKALVAGKTFHRPSGGFVGVTNVGLDTNWLGSDFAQANLYAFGRLAWNPNLSSADIAREWTTLTFGYDPRAIETITSMQLRSWRVYENYTGPLGLQTLTAITGDHYGVSVEASERNGWGQWHRSDEKGAGMDRTVATGTGFIGQYRPAVARIYESLATCPDDLLLFMHHVPYTHRLHSGKTVIQYIYDSHYQGAESAEQYVRDWKTLRHSIDEDRYRELLGRLEYQAGQAEEWRDAVVSWYRKTSGIADEKGRAGHHPGRTETESMKLDGYAVADVQPWETASGGKAVECRAARCAASFRFDGPPGWYEVRVRYFDQNNGASRFRTWLGDQLIADWVADDRLPNAGINGSTSSLKAILGIALRPGDEIRVEGTPDGKELAALDYVEIRPEDY